MLSMEARKGNTCRFIFSSERFADSFAAYAENKYDSANVQFPYDTSGKGKIKTEVLVTGTGSANYDLIMNRDLERLAITLGGILMPSN